jgi:glycosyltransferase involved in cell wall biosynthesis
MEIAPQVVSLIDYFDVKEMVDLYRRADAFVLATRGEGWGLPYMEAMASGLPTIGTDWGGQTDFMNDENSFSIRSSLMPVSSRAVQEYRLFDGQRWAEPDVSDLQEVMRTVYNGGPRISGVAAAGRNMIRSRYSGQALLDHLSSCVQLSANRARALS